MHVPSYICAILLPWTRVWEVGFLRGRVVLMWKIFSGVLSTWALTNHFPLAPEGIFVFLSYTSFLSLGSSSQGEARHSLSQHPLQFEWRHVVWALPLRHPMRHRHRPSPNLTWRGVCRYCQLLDRAVAPSLVLETLLLSSAQCRNWLIFS